MVTVISSKAERQKDIEAIGAKRLSAMEDTGFLSAIFKEADVVYVMEVPAPGVFFDQNVNAITAITNIGNNYKQVKP